MNASKQYFPHRSGDPSPLMAQTRSRVRFEEVDSLGMVWHGRYSSYFEDGRIGFGDTYGLTYHRFREKSTVAPVVQLHFDFKRPLRFDDQITIETTLHWSDAARLNFSYNIYTVRRELAASGYTVQLFTEPDGTVLLVVPSWLNEFHERWKSGGFAG